MFTQQAYSNNIKRKLVYLKNFVLMRKLPVNSYTAWKVSK